MKKDISVAMSVYKSDNPIYLHVAIESVFNQTLLPKEVVLVGDGPLSTDLNDVISELQQKYPNLVFLPQKVNRGLGEALRIACDNCSCDYIARMDADDIALPQRFKLQMACFEENPEISVVGGFITEFEGEPVNIINYRRLPLTDTEIKKFMIYRSGLNHVTVIMRKDALMKAGNYSGDIKQEDYYLWARMWKCGCQFRNIPDVVVNVRSGANQFARRGGLKYFQNHMKIFCLMYKWNLITFPQLVKNYIFRFGQVAIPNNLRAYIYKNFLRK